MEKRQFSLKQHEPAISAELLADLSFQRLQVLCEALEWMLDELPLDSRLSPHQRGVVFESCPLYRSFPPEMLPALREVFLQENQQQASKTLGQLLDTVRHQLDRSFDQPPHPPTV